MTDHVNYSILPTVLNVACVADEYYIPHCATMLASLLEHNPASKIHFLHAPNTDGEMLAKLKRFVVGRGGEFFLHAIPDDWISGLPRISQIPPLMWYRVYLPDLLPGLDRILYLDADTLICGSLEDLWRTPLDGYYLAAVGNVFEPAMSEWPRTLGLEFSDRYFNSGVLLLNLEAMRRDGITEQLVSFGRNPPMRLKWPDQDSLNCVLAKGVVALHPRWNCQNSLFYLVQAKRHFGRNVVAEATKDPRIVHFEGGSIAKPWHYLSRHPYRNDYLKFRQQTPWCDFEPIGRNNLNRMLKFLPFSAVLSVLKWSALLRRRMAIWRK